MKASENTSRGEWNTVADRSAGAGNGGSADGFTLLELLVVVGMVCMLAVMVFSARASGGADAQAMVCQNNLRQLQLAWRLYTDDNYEKLPFSADSGHTAQTTIDALISDGAWCQGRMDVSANGSSTNTALIAAGSIFPYANSLQIYKCPADKKTTAAGVPTVRSVSMNCWLGPIDSWNQIGPGNPFASPYPGRNIYKLSDMDINPPSNTFVFLDEDARSINDAWFVINVAPPSAYGSLLWADFPSTVHGEAGGLAFGDGHTELRKWTDPALFRATIIRGGAATGPDLSWLSARASIPQ